MLASSASRKTALETSLDTSIETSLESSLETMETKLEAVIKSLLRLIGYLLWFLWLWVFVASCNFAVTQGRHPRSCLCFFVPSSQRAKYMVL